MKERVEFALLSLGTAVAAATFVVSLGFSLHEALFHQKPLAIVIFFMTGFPVLSGAAAALFFCARRAVQSGRRQPATSLFAAASLLYLLVAVLMAAFAFVAPTS